MYTIVLTVLYCMVLYRISTILYCIVLHCSVRIRFRANPVPCGPGSVRIWSVLIWPVRIRTRADLFRADPMSSLLGECLGGLPWSNFPSASLPGPPLSKCKRLSLQSSASELWVAGEQNGGASPEAADERPAVLESQQGADRSAQIINTIDF